MLLTLGSHVFDAAAFTHGLNHDRQAVGMWNGRIHFHEFGTSHTPAPDPLSEAEHKLLHSVGGIEPSLVSSLADNFGPPPADVMPPLPRSFSLDIIDQDPPFRPPQATCRI